MSLVLRPLGTAEWSSPFPCDLSPLLTSSSPPQPGLLSLCFKKSLGMLMQTLAWESLFLFFCSFVLEFIHYTTDNGLELLIFLPLSPKHPHVLC